MAASRENGIVQRVDVLEAGWKRHERRAGETREWRSQLGERSGDERETTHLGSSSNLGSQRILDIVQLLLKVLREL